MTQSTTQNSPARSPRRERTGVVISDARNKTIKVRFEYQFEHPRYGKQIRRRGTLHAHDEQNQAKAGDRVLVMECRPISKTKSWRLEKILHTAAQTKQ